MNTKHDKGKKHSQLGMNPSTASHRLVKDILFRFVQTAGHVCHQCGEVLTRDTFSVEHMEPWLDTEDPIGLYFDLDNIAFSHLSCNSAASRTPNKKYYSKREMRDAHNARDRERWAALPKEEQQRRRRENYLRIGK